MQGTKIQSTHFVAVLSPKIFYLHVENGGSIQHQNTQKPDRVHHCMESPESDGLNAREQAGAMAISLGAAVAADNVSLFALNQRS